MINMESISRALFPVGPGGATAVALASCYGFISKFAQKENPILSANTVLPSSVTNAISRLSPLNQTILLCTLASLSSIMVLTLVQKLLLKKVLSYTRYLTEGRGKASAKSTIWGILMSNVFRSSNETFAYQSFLPNLPVPELEDTIKRWLVSVQPLYFGKEQEYEALKKRATSFLNSDAAKQCQRALLNKAAHVDNYVDDWWLQYAYLKDRSSIMINSNYYAFTLDMKPPTNRATSRAAFYLHRFVRMAHDIEAQKIPVQKLPAKAPLCMNQYRQCLSITRIPGQEMDSLKFYSKDESRHVVVIRKGRYYTVPVYGIAHQIGAWKMFPPSHFEMVFDSILKDADDSDNSSSAEKDADDETQRNIPLLTGWNRTKWAQVREEHLLKNETNKKALEAIESAMMVISFDDDEVSNYEWDDLNTLGHIVEHGGSSSSRSSSSHKQQVRWYDKSVTMCVSTANAMIGFNCEHSFADAPMVGHFLDECMASEMQDNPYESFGRVSAKLGAHPGTIKSSSAPEGNQYSDGDRAFKRFSFDVSSGTFRAAVAQAAKDVGAAGDDLDMHITRFTDFGRTKVSREFKLSPDAFIQAAMHLAYLRLHGEMAQTYESATARLYLNGRTETIRSATNEMSAFIRALNDFTTKKDGEGSSSSSEKEKIIKLFRAASDRHAALTGLAMTGQGVDRHLFALYIASMGLDRSSSSSSSVNEATQFLREDVMSRGWKMTSSQVPYGQSTAWKDKAGAPDKYRRANGGFGPVHKDGYGISYAVAGSDRFVVHVTSFKSSKESREAKVMNDEILKAFKYFESLFSK